MSLLKKSPSKSKPKLTVAGSKKKSHGIFGSKRSKKAAKPSLNVAGGVSGASLPKVAKKGPLGKAGRGTRSHRTLGGGKSPNTLAYTVPPIILLCIFGYCATHTFTPAPKPVAPAVAVQSPAAGTTTPSLSAPVQPDDRNNDLPAYAWGEPQVNMLTTTLAKVSQSGASKSYAAENAIDGSLRNDAKLAQATAASGQTWWKADFINGSSPRSVSTLVIYGGGSASPIGKLKGGFEVHVEGIGGESYTRRFCEDGFALEGFEEWTLDVPTKLRTITITPLKEGSSLVLREVQAISSN